MSKAEEPVSKSKWLSGPRINPEPIAKGVLAADLIDGAFLSYNAGRLQKASRLYVEKMLAPEAFVGMSLTGALTPAGLGRSVIIPLIRAGFVDWIVSTGANLYHDAHFGLGLAMHQGTHEVDDRVLRAEGVVRIYDILFDYKVLLETDAYLRKVMTGPEFLEELRSDKTYADLPVLLLTAWPERAAGLKGAQGIVAKPLDLDQLVDTISKRLQS